MTKFQKAWIGFMPAKTKKNTTLQDWLLKHRKASTYDKNIIELGTTSRRQELQKTS